MTNASVQGGTADVPAQVFDKFLEALGEAGVAAVLIARLRKTLLEDKVFTERALNEAVLKEDPHQ